MQTRLRLWNNLMDLRFKAFYYQRCGDSLAFADRACTVFTGVVATASAGAWLYTKDYPKLWAFLIGVSQALSVVRSLLPVFRRSSDFKRCSLEVEKLYIAVEKRWFEVERSDDDEAREKVLQELRTKLLKIDGEFSALPKLPDTPLYNFTKRARRDIDDFVRLNFPEISNKHE